MFTLIKLCIVKLCNNNLQDENMFYYLNIKKEKNIKNKYFLQCIRQAAPFVRPAFAHLCCRDAFARRATSA